MNWLPIATFTFIIGLVLGGLIIALMQRKTAKDKEIEIDTIKKSLEASFGNLSLDALQKSTEEFLKLAKEKLGSEREVNKKDLDEKKGLIDLQLKNMTTKLEDASKLMKELEKDREKKFGELAEQLKKTGEQTVHLTETAGKLREALASTKVRGEWGQRMAEDVLHLVGFVENINYIKQKAVEEGRSIPDFTFFLPKSQKLNMDVKFPFEKYMKFLESDSESDKTKFRNDFLRAVKTHIKEVASREYINPERNTVDYALLFIPNEQVYAFIFEQDSLILDEGLKNKVILCSPITLYAILVVIRQAVDIFRLEKTANETLSLLGAVWKQWDAFCEKMELVGKRIGEAQEAYDILSTTRRRQLEKPLSKIEEIRKQHGLPIASDEEDKKALPFVEESTKEEDI